MSPSSPNLALLVAVMVWGLLVGFGVGCDYMRRRCRLLQAKQIEQASKHVTHGLRVISGGH